MPDVSASVLGKEVAFEIVIKTSGTGGYSCPTQSVYLFLYSAPTVLRQ